MSEGGLRSAETYRILQQSSTNMLWLQAFVDRTELGQGSIGSMTRLQFPFTGRSFRDSSVSGNLFFKQLSDNFSNECRGNQTENTWSACMKTKARKKSCKHEQIDHSECRSDTYKTLHAFRAHISGHIRNLFLTCRSWLQKRLSLTSLALTQELLCEHSMSYHRIEVALSTAVCDAQPHDRIKK